MWLELMEHGDAVIFARPLSLYRRHEEQEGAQAEVIVRSRVEWRRLVEEYWHKRIFITQEQDYRHVLARIAEERSVICSAASSGSRSTAESVRAGRVSTAHDYHQSCRGMHEHTP